MKVTGAEIARRVGCSPAAVSRTFNGTGPVTDDVRNAVLEEARKSGYNPLRKKSADRNRKDVKTDAKATEVIFVRHDKLEPVKVSDEGVEVGPLRTVPAKELSASPYRLAGAFYRHILEGVAEQLQESGQKVLLQSVNDLSEVRIRDRASANDDQGVILLVEGPPTHDGPSRAVADFVDRCSRPLVLVDIWYDGWPDLVTIDNLGGASAAVQHLVDLGHRKLGFVGIDDDAFFNERRVGFEWKLMDLGLPVRREWVTTGGKHIEPTIRRAVQLLQRDDRPSALFCCNDWTALSVLQAAREVGLSVPGDLSVVGFDDLDVAGFTHPGLTTVHVPTAELGRQAVRQLLIQPKSRPVLKSPGCVVRVKTRLVVRGSTAKLAE